MPARDPDETITSNKAECRLKKPDAVDVGDDYDPQYHEGGVAGMAFYVSLHAKKSITDHYNLRNQLPIAITDVSIDNMTEAYATVQVFAQTGQNQHGRLTLVLLAMSCFYVFLPNSSPNASVQMENHSAYTHQMPI